LKPSSPADTKVAIPGWSKNASICTRISGPCSGPPQLLLITVAPSVAAAPCPNSIPAPWLSVAWTTRILHSGHAALTMSMSSAVSTRQSSLTGGFGGSGVVAPSWFTILRQPLAIVHAGKPYCERYTARSASSAE
jgi:hypothetical protein